MSNYLIFGWSWSYFDVRYTKLYHSSISGVHGHQFELGWVWFTIYPKGKYK